MNCIFKSVYYIDYVDNFYIMQIYDIFLLEKDKGFLMYGKFLYMVLDILFIFCSFKNK